MKGARKFGILHFQPEVTNTMKLYECMQQKRKQTNKQKGIVLTTYRLIEIDVARKDNNRCSSVVWLLRPKDMA